MSLTIQQIITPQTRDQYKATGVATLVGLGIPANRWAQGGVYDTILTYSCQVLAMLSTTLSNTLAAFYLPTAVANAIASGDSGLLILLATYAYGVTVPTATFAAGQVTLTNAGGGVYSIADGAMTLLNPATNQTYVNKGAFTLGASSSLTINVQCTVPGTVGNANPGAITVLVTALLGVTASNGSSIVGIDTPTPTAIQALCLSSLGARSVRGPRGAYAYAILTAKNATTGAPVNVTKYKISTASHMGVVTITVASPAGPVTVDDILGVRASIEGTQGNPLTGARPDGITANASVAALVTYQPTLQPYVLAPQGTDATVIQAAIETQLTTMMASQQGNPIGGVTVLDDTHPTGFTGLTADAVKGAVAVGVASVAGCAMVSCLGAVDLALADNAVATDSITVLTPIIVSVGS